MKFTGIKLLTAWLVVSFFSAMTSAQTLIKANDKFIRYDLIKPAREFYKETIYDANGKIKDEITGERLTRIDAANGQISFTSSAQSPLGQQYTDVSTMTVSGAPVSYRLSSNPFKQSVDVTFGLDSAVAQINESRTESGAIKMIAAGTTKVMLPAGYFDDNIVEDLLGYMPFVAGEKYYLNTFTIDFKPNVNPFEIEYLFDDICQTPKGNSIKCRVLHYTTARNDTYIWIDQTSRATIKEVIRAKDGRTVVIQKI